MDNRKNLEYEIFDKLENATTKISQKVYDVLDRKGIPEIIADTDNKVFWFEIHPNGNNCPAYIYAWLKKYIKREYGYSYLQDTTPQNNTSKLRK